MKLAPICALIPLLGPLAPEATAQAPKRLALLVAVDEYLDPPASFSNLDGCVNDIQRIRKILESKKFGFKSSEILVLTNEQATHAGFVRAFHDHLIARAGANTRVLFWYSGHGSRTPDASGVAGAEADGQDSTLVLHDSRANGDVFDLTDDELHSLIRALCAKSDDVTVITDCCHSGGNTRGPGGAKSRAVQPGKEAVNWDRVKALWPAGIPLMDDGDPGRFGALPYVHLAACAFDQRAGELEVRGGDGEWTSYGAMSYFLGIELQKLSPGTSWDRLARQVGMQVARHKGDQDVQAEGETQRLVFGAGFAPTPPGFPGIAWPEQTSLDIHAGSAHLLRQGSIMEVTDLNGKLLGKAEITRIWAEKSRANWVGVPPDLRSEISVQAVEVQRPVGSDPILLYVEPGKKGDDIASLLSSRPDQLLEITREPVRGNGYQLWQPQGGREWELSTCADGLVLNVAEGLSFRAPSQILADRVGLRMLQESRYLTLLQLGSSRNSSVPLEISIRIPSEETIQALREARNMTAENLNAAEIRQSQSRGLNGETAGTMEILDHGGEENVDLFQIVVDLPENHPPVFISILNVSEDRSISVIYPTGQRRDNQFRGSDPPLLANAHIFVDPEWTLDRPSRERFLILATEEWVDFTPLQREAGIRKTRSGDGGVILVTEDGFPPELLQALHPGKTRGAGGFAPKRAGFGVAALDVLVTGV